MAVFPEILTTSRFYLELKLEGSQDSVDGVFMDCSGFQATQDVIEICEVTPQLWGKAGKSKGRVMRTKIPGSMKYSNITLQRGLLASMTLWNWLEKVQEGYWDEERRDGSLVIYDQAATEQFRLEFQRAWPICYQISDLDVKSGEYAIETLEITVEGLKRIKV